MQGQLDCLQGLNRAHRMRYLTDKITCCKEPPSTLSGRDHLLIEVDSFHARESIESQDENARREGQPKKYSDLVCFYNVISQHKMPKSGGGPW